MHINQKSWSVAINHPHGLKLCMKNFLHMLHFGYVCARCLPLGVHMQTFEIGLMMHFIRVGKVYVLSCMAGQ